METTIRYTLQIGSLSNNVRSCYLLGKQFLCISNKYINNSMLKKCCTCTTGSTYNLQVSNRNNCKSEKKYVTNEDDSKCKMHLKHTHISIRLFTHLRYCLGRRNVLQKGMQLQPSSANCKDT